MEQRVIASCDHGALPGVSIDRPETPQQLCRHDTDCRLWLAMELVQIESNIRKRSRCVHACVCITISFTHKGHDSRYIELYQHYESICCITLQGVWIM